MLLSFETDKERYQCHRHVTSLCMQELLERVAAGLLVEVDLTKRCPLQCITTCIVLAIMHCANSLGSLQPIADPNDAGKIRFADCKEIHQSKASFATALRLSTT